MLKSMFLTWAPRQVVIDDAAALKNVETFSPLFDQSTGSVEFDANVGTARSNSDANISTL